MGFKIDKITWNDLNMDAVLAEIDVAQSSVGSEFLRKTIEYPEFDIDVLSDRDSKINYFSLNQDISNRISKIFKSLGKTKKVSFLDYIFELKNVKKTNNAQHYLLIILLLLSLISIFIQPVIGIIALVIMITVNIITYFRAKSEIESYFNCCKYLVNMVVAAEKITKINLSDPFQDLTGILSESIMVFAKVKRGSWLITNSVSGSLIDVVLDYVRMLFHVDIIKFNNMQSCIMENEEYVIRLYNALGLIETCICAAEYRKKVSKFTRPDFTDEKHILAENVGHPLVKKPVYNSIDTVNSILLTGSNASGKSTFLKTIAINQILAQSLYTCIADKFETSFFKVISSMALTDNILGEESYFVVEIKSLKRIFDNIGEIPVLAFIDEVLRGTNTKERIAASSQILKSLAENNVLVFAATHDIELTKLLSGTMENYHFNEVIENDKVIFDYKLKPGASETRNALKLLEVYGFDPEIIKNAEKLADCL